MKGYVLCTGMVFGLLAGAHIWRIVEEGTHLATDPFFAAITLAAAALSVWAWRLLWVARHK